MEEESFGCGMLVGAIVGCSALLIAAYLSFNSFDETMRDVKEKIETECVIHEYESYEKNEDKNKVVVTFRCD